MLSIAVWMRKPAVVQALLEQSELLLWKDGDIAAYHHALQAFPLAILVGDAAILKMIVNAPGMRHHLERHEKPWDNLAVMFWGDHFISYLEQCGLWSVYPGHLGGAVALHQIRVMQLCLDAGASVDTPYGLPSGISVMGAPGWGMNVLQYAAAHATPLVYETLLSYP